MKPSPKRICEDLSYFNKTSKRPKMEGSSLKRDCNTDFVRMPWDDESEIILHKDDKTTVLSRWHLIQMQLHDSTKISNVEELIEVLKSYNVVRKNGKQSYPSWKCLVLRQYFAELQEHDKNKFFMDNGVLSTIRNLSLQLKVLLPKLKVLKIAHPASLRLHQIQVASILANAFLCTFPKERAGCPSINFISLYESCSNSIQKNCVEKMKCLMHYFTRIHTKQPIGNISFYRLFIPDHELPRWDKTNVSLCSLKVEVTGKIEDQEGFLQMDFANRYIGGGVLGKGCVQEEIRFIVCPELIAARLFTESLTDNEAIFVEGAERYCNYKGYADTFEFSGNFQDLTAYDENEQRKTYLIILDALYFHKSSEQYRESKILRELKKAYIGFKPLKNKKMLPLATGNWGCGAFGGDPQLKSILQLMASSQAKRDMVYLTFGNSILKNQIQELYLLLKEKAVNVGTLYRIIRLYNREKKKNQTVFDFVKESIDKYVKCKSPLKLEESSSSSRSNNEFLLLNKAAGTLEMNEISSEDFFNMEINFTELDVKIENYTIGKNSEVSSEKILDKNNFQEKPKLNLNSRLFDMWLSKETYSANLQGDKNFIEHEQYFEKIDVTENAQNLSLNKKEEPSIYDKSNNSDLLMNNCLTQDLSLSLERKIDKGKKETQTSGYDLNKAPSKKLVQKKITELLKK